MQGTSVRGGHSRVTLGLSRLCRVLRLRSRPHRAQLCPRVLHARRNNALFEMPVCVPILKLDARERSLKLCRILDVSVEPPFAAAVAVQRGSGKSA